ncbi:MAG TPA: hypothetical protein PKA05_09735 [Roseiflexaceae bacterium]|nr:hypothetical protein [Roseiflexaceae bacterium]
MRSNGASLAAHHFMVVMERGESMMDGKNVIYGETALDRLVQELRANGQPQDITWLTERYLEILRELVQAEEQTA